MFCTNFIIVVVISIVATGILIKDKDVNIHELLYDNGVSRNVTK